MNAADLPVTWSSAASMVRGLVTYLRTDEAVYRAVSERFGSSPGLSEIAAARKRHNRKPRSSGSEYSRLGAPIIEDDDTKMQRINDVAFVARLRVYLKELEVRHG
jgi:hypothetical protein